MHTCICMHAHGAGLTSKFFSRNLVLVRQQLELRNENKKARAELGKAANMYYRKYEEIRGNDLPLTWMQKQKRERLYQKVCVRVGLSVCVRARL